ncbi:kynurenine/alpha-aminoadipate aminotransferase, mitochondrial-like [Osmia bicornis bicornis]|uniref:kynurenine/alpha-aminoadipate aminotransferase, mitochondrial-like n=1 Tax=Osmia bicornis bicornis TaxID=1437191 RepID=UPI0010F8A967|nr:kynurenine/alpha-aminoadipate aminotransferase, mitochondrial-like [Osmia bicornis bicornis]
MDVARFLTNFANRRKHSILRKWAKIFVETEGAISLANGMPNAEMFPFEEIAVTYKNGTKIKLVGDELSWSLQYGPSQGYLPLLKQMRQFQEYWHKPEYNDWDILFTPGSMDGCTKVFEMTVEEEDPVMVQMPTYNGILNALAPFMIEFLGIPQDKDGIIPEQITKICEERSRNGKKLPKILYVNPTGANPTGTVLSESRRRKVYELAQKYDFLIIEDDPYCFLHFLDKRPTTFLELDTVGRVIRLDSFSKILSAGMRLGVVTAHKEFIQKLTVHMETTSLHASSLSQMLLYQLLNSWGLQKLQQHFEDVQKFYRERRDVMLSLIEKHLTGLAEWNVPNGGMFVWIKVNEIENVLELVTEKCISKGIFVLPGHAFNYDFSDPEQHIRLCYSYSTPDQIDKALSVLAQLIREEMAQQKLN